MNTQERIQLIEAMVKVINANQKNHDKEMVKFANEKIKALTKSMIKPTGDIVLTPNKPNQEPKEGKKINLQAVEELLNTIYESTFTSRRITDDNKEIWRIKIGYTLDDLED